MTWDVWEIQIFRTQKLDGGTFEQCVMLFAYVSSILDRFVADIVHVLDRLGCVPLAAYTSKIKTMADLRLLYR